MKWRPLFIWVLFLAIIPSQQRAMAASGMFLKMPAATNVYVIDCRNCSGDAKMTVWCLQGLINRRSAEVYVLSTPDGLEQIQTCGKLYTLIPPLEGHDSGLRILFQKYGDRVKKMFLYDPAKRWTFYLALMAGAQQDGIPVSRAMKGLLTSESDWKGEVVDYRSRWTNDIEAYEWALTNLMPECDKHVVFTPRSGMPIIDYAVACKGFAFWLDFNTNADDRAEAEKIFSTKGYGVGTSLMGYASGGDKANTLANRYGIGYVVSDRYANGSFWSSFPDKTYTQPLGTAIKAEPGKVYASIAWSDGDNIAFDQNPLYKFWHNEDRGKVPVATLLSPTLQELNPTLLDWYYDRMTTNDELVSGVSGVQYIFPEDYNEALFPAWCQLSHDWCEDAGFHSIRTSFENDFSSKEMTYFKICRPAGVLGHGTLVHSGFPPKVGIYWIGSEQRLGEQFEAVLKPNSRAPVFVNFFLTVQKFNEEGDSYDAVKR